MKPPKDAVPQGQKPNLPSAVLWIGLVLFLAFLVGLVIYSARNPQQSSASTTEIGNAADLPVIAYATGPVHLSQKAYPETMFWDTPPRGPCELDGTPFHIHGAIRTSGLDAARWNRNLPGATWNIPVHLGGTRIHLLQGLEHAWSGMVTGAPYARFVLHYANGQTHKFDLKCAIHGFDWGPRANEPEEAVLDPNTRVAWSIPPPPTWSRRVRCLRLYHTVLENPFPNTLITSFDVITTFSVGNLLLFGFTVDNDPRPLAPPFKETNPVPPPQSITFTLQNAAGTPLPGAQFSWIAKPPQGQIVFPACSADALGQIQLEVPNGTLAEIHYKASGPDGKQAAGTLQPDANGLFPANPIIRVASITRSIIPTAHEGGAAEWRYTTQKPATNWYAPEFDDSNWKTGTAGFGTPNTPGAVVRTYWKTPEIYLRREFILPEGGLQEPQLTLHHDDDAQVYINGTLEASAGGYLIDYEIIPLSARGRQALRPGTNVLAIRCRQVFGEQYIDAGLSDLIPAK